MQFFKFHSYVLSSCCAHTVDMKLCGLRVARGTGPLPAMHVSLSASSMAVFWDVTPRSLVCTDRRFRGVLAPIRRPGGTGEFYEIPVGIVGGLWAEI
jgi:hypothetical protein